MSAYVSICIHANATFMFNLIVFSARNIGLSSTHNLQSHVSLLKLSHPHPVRPLTPSHARLTTSPLRSHLLVRLVHLNTVRPTARSLRVHAHDLLTINGCRCSRCAEVACNTRARQLSSCLSIRVDQALLGLRMRDHGLSLRQHPGRGKRLALTVTIKGSISCPQPPTRQTCTA